ncbi:MAG: class I SAM-dependent methyltransferase, partial [Pyrinomonadaceae bacterium]
MSEATSLQTNSDGGDRRREYAESVREMFAGIAARYDLLNHLLSANVDRRWRARVVARLRENLSSGRRALDIACGTGDLSLALAEGG